jgi:two-component system sensor histidine kinase UhpB
MSLRSRINLLITILMLAFLLATGNIVISNIRKSVEEEIEASTKVTVQLLTTVIYSSQFVPGNQTQRELLLNFLQNLGRVRANEIRLYDNLGDPVYVSPPSTYKAGRDAPEWFSTLVAPKSSVVNLRVRGGALHIVPDSSRSVLDAWDDLRGLIWAAAAFFLVVNVLVFWLVGRSLKPLKQILAGLKKMEAGQFSARLPRFKLPEFGRVSNTFNSMAETLEDSVAENQRLALIVKQTGDAILIRDFDGKILFWNPAAERLFGYASEEILGKSAEILAPPERKAEMEENLMRVARRELIENLETQRVTREGRVLDVALSAAPLVDPRSEAVVGAIVSLRDITEKKKAEEAERELEQKRELTQLIQRHIEEERRALARELHDELGQSATAIKTIAMTIANRAGEREPEIHSQAKTIVSVAGQLYDMVHGMIHQLRPSALDHLGLPDALQEAVATWRSRHPDTQFALRLGAGLEDLGEALNVTIYRMIQECVTNAIRHAKSNQVRISVTREPAGAHEEALRVVVQDDGVGMSAGAAQAKGRIGLLGMRERVEALGGQLEITSRPGEGVRVGAKIPIVQ